MDRVARVFIVDDHPIVRQGLTALIDQEADLAVCGEADALDVATSRITELLPDLVIVDLSLGQEDGIQLIRFLRERVAGLPVLVVTMHDQPRSVHQAVQSGARGYLTKREVAGNVLVAIRTLLDGKTYVGERVAGHLEEPPFDARVRPTADPPDLLTAREFQIFLLIGGGLSTRRIAGKLSLSAKTVETHYERIKCKLGLSHSVELRLAAIRWVFLRGEN